MNIVLVHGAWCDASSWRRVIPLLQEAGHTVHAPQLALRALADDVETVASAVDGPVVLVGHSYGGAVISGAAARAAGPVALVYVAAYAPDEGESVLDLGGRRPPTAGAGAIRPDAAGLLRLDPEQFPAVFAADLDPVEARVLATVQKPTAGACFGAPSGPVGWRAASVAYVRSAQDRMIDPELQAWMAERTGAALTSLDSSHASPLSHPAEIAAAVLRAAREPATA